MKKIIFVGLISLFSITVFTGCMSEHEKKAKDITVKKIIEEDEKAKKEKENKGKSADFRKLLENHPIKNSLNE